MLCISSPRNQESDDEEFLARKKRGKMGLFQAFSNEKWALSDLEWVLGSVIDIYYHSNG